MNFGTFQKKLLNYIRIKLNEFFEIIYFKLIFFFHNLIFFFSRLLFENRKNAYIKKNLLIFFSDKFWSKTKFESQENSFLIGIKDNRTEIQHLDYNSFSIVTLIRLLSLANIYSNINIVLSSWNYGKPPFLKFIKYLSKKNNIKISIILWDTCTNKINDYIKDTNFSSKYIIVDNPQSYFLDKSMSYKYIHCPIEIFLINQKIKNIIFPLDNRKYKASFFGQVNSYRDYRLEFLSHLKTNFSSDEIFISSEKREDHTRSFDEYLDLVSQSIMSINLSYSVDSHQIKARIFESTSRGSLLLESDNEQIKKYFTPYKHYIPFFNKYDLAEKIKYYSNNLDITKEIIINAQKRFKEIVIEYELFESLDS